MNIENHLKNILRLQEPKEYEELIYILGKDTSVNKKLSIPTQAIKLFSECKSVIEVIIILDRPISEIQDIIMIICD